MDAVSWSAPIFLKRRQTGNLRISTGRQTVEQRQPRDPVHCYFFTFGIGIAKYIFHYIQNGSQNRNRIIKL